MRTTESLPSNVELAVRAMCADYDRRALEIERGKLSPEVIGHYMILNAVIDRALAECCEADLTNQMRRDIGENIGHRNTQLYFLSAAAYKLRKRKSKHAIAKALHLI